MNAEELKTKIAEIDSKITALQKARQELSSSLGALLAPFAVGDTVQWTTERGWAPNKKVVINRARITRIDSRYNGYQASGIRIRKDGSDGNYVNVYDFYNATKVES